MKTFVPDGAFIRVPFRSQIAKQSLGKHPKEAVTFGAGNAICAKGVLEWGFLSKMN
jgi:hypothetical protein